jgi:hypothetical protein
LPLLDSKELLAALARCTPEVSTVKVKGRLASAFGAAEASFVLIPLTWPVVDDKGFSANLTASKFSDMFDTTLGPGDDGVADLYVDTMLPGNGDVDLVGFSVSLMLSEVEVRNDDLVNLASLVVLASDVG